MDLRLKISHGNSKSDFLSSFFVACLEATHRASAQAVRKFPKEIKITSYKPTSFMIRLG